MDLLTFINFYLIPGIVIGSIYASGAIGITLLFGILRFANLAHGDMITLGAFLTLFIITLGAPFWLALPFAMIVTVCVLIGIDKLFFAYLRPRPRIMMVMASLGIAFMIRAFVQVIWGVDTTSYTSGISRPMNLGGILLQTREIWTIATLIITVATLYIFMKFTIWGKAMRAYSNNDELVSLCGISTNHLIIITWIIVGCLVTMSGFFMGLNTELKSMMGWHLILPMFAAAILGGVGRIDGAILGALVIGISEELSVLFFPAEYKSAIAFALLLITLLFRPTGILKGKVL